jgi:hypothetical protein
MHDFAPCALHGERACPDCYGCPATSEEVSALLSLHQVLETAGAKIGALADIERHYRVHPPTCFGLVQLCASYVDRVRVATWLPRRQELRDLALELLGRLRDRLERRGRGEAEEAYPWSA